jgi:hypothetical protein
LYFIKQVIFGRLQVFDKVTGAEGALGKEFKIINES